MNDDNSALPTSAAAPVIKAQPNGSGSSSEQAHRIPQALVGIGASAEGLAALRQPRWRYVRVFDLSVQQNDATRESMRSGGAAALVSKSDDAEIFVNTIRKASRAPGSTWID